jgi:putative oxidoreductase
MSFMIDFAASIYRKLILSGIYFAPVALLILRIGWGWESAESGYRHFKNFDKTVAFFQSLDIPNPKMATAVSATAELVGGSLIIVGLGARAVSLPLIFNFAVAIATASKDNVKMIFKQDYSNIVDDTAYPFLIMAIIIFAFGPGLFSIDGILKKTVFKKYAAGLPSA